MIISNLSEILGKKRLKISKVIKDTGISRPTLTNLYYNDSLGINFDTLSTLCTYLNITPNDLLYHSKIDIDNIYVKFDDFTIEDEQVDYEGNSVVVIKSAPFNGFIKLCNSDIEEIKYSGYLLQYAHDIEFSLNVKMQISEHTYNLVFDDIIGEALKEHISESILEEFQSIFGNAYITGEFYSFSN